MISRNDSTGNELDAVVDSSLKERSKFVVVVVGGCCVVVGSCIVGNEKNSADVVAN